MGWPEWLALLAVVGYLIAFYSQPLDSATAIPRWIAHFIWLVQPEQLAREWVGGDLSRWGLLDRLPILGVAAGVLLTAFLAGRLLLAGLRLDQTLDTIELVVFATGAGANLLSLATLLLGLLGQLQSRRAFLAVGVLVVGLAIWRQSTWRTTRSSSERSRSQSPGSLAWAAPAVSVVFTVLILLGAMLPPWHFDVREYHLQIPKEWYLQGRIGFVPHNVYGNMPLGAEMHAVAGMAILRDWWYGALVGKTIIAAFAPLTGLALYAFGRRFFCGTTGAVAAAIYLSTPWTVSVSMTGLIEAPYGFYFFAAVYAAVLALRSASEGSHQEGGSAAWRLAALAGFLAGAAVSCKYPALLFLVVPLAFVVAVLPGWRWQGRSLLAFVLAVVAGCGLWLGKNAVLTGNPTYPLLYRWFDGRGLTEAKDAQWRRAHETPPDGLTLAHARSSLRLITLTSQYLSPLLIPFAALGLLPRQHRTICWPLGYLTLYVVAMWWLLTHRVDRFLFPLLPQVCLLAGVGAIWSSARGWQNAMLALLLGISLANFVFGSSRAVSDNRFFVALADLREDMPHPQDPPEADAPRYTHRHAAHRYLNQAVPPGYRVLLVGEAQVFDLEIPLLYNTCFDDCVFEELLRDRSTEERRQTLRDQRISHVFIFWRELDRYRSPGNYGYSDYVTRERIRDEFVRTGIFREIPTGTDPENSQLFEVVGWETWE